jgi:paraquat-inducible protein B
LLADDATGLNIGDVISYQGLEVGNITALDFSENGEFIETKLRINHQYQYLVNSSSQFYLLTGINVKASLKGFEVQSAPFKNLVSGGIGLYNKFPVPKNQKQAKLNNNIKFRLYPSLAMAKIGKNVFSEPYSITLLSKQLPSITEGSPVYYHKFPIGEVSNFSMDSNGLMRTTLAIKGQYKHLIQEVSVFWNVSGIKINAGLSGVKVEAESLLSIANGGIAVENAPDSVSNRYESGEFRLFESYQQATQPSQQISITFDEGYELQVGTKLRLKGLVVGEVTSLSLNSNQRVQVNADIQPEFINQVTKKSTRFWIIRSELSLTGTKNLSTIVSGVYLNVHPGEGELSTRFVGEGSAPSISNQKLGLPIILTADNAGSTNVGSPVYHRQIQIGEVVEKQLSKDVSAAQITVNIYPQYTHIIRENSIFWPASGFNIDIGITGASLKSTSLTSLIKGGINMSTTDSKPLQPAAKAFTKYSLKTYFDEDWLKWRLAIPEK